MKGKTDRHDENCLSKPYLLGGLRDASGCLCVAGERQRRTKQTPKREKATDWMTRIALSSLLSSSDRQGRGEGHILAALVRFHPFFSTVSSREGIIFDFYEQRRRDGPDWLARAERIGSEDSLFREEKYSQYLAVVKQKKNIVYSDK